MTKADENKGTVPDEEAFAKAWDETDTADTGDGDRNEDEQALSHDEDAAAQTAEESDDKNSSEQDQSLESGENRAVEEEPDYRALWEKDHQRMKSWEGRLSKAEQEKKAMMEELERLKQEMKPPTQVASHDGPGDDRDTGTEDAGQMPVTSDAFRAEYGDEIADFVEQRARELARQEMEQVLSERIAPLENAKAEQEVQAHYSAIAEKHPDYQEIAESADFQKWIDDQPAYIQQAIKNVVVSGSADQVNELLSSYKQAMNADKRNTQQRDARARRSAAVPGRSGGAPRAVPKDDFDKAWDSM